MMDVVNENTGSRQLEINHLGVRRSSPAGTAIVVSADNAYRR